MKQSVLIALSLLLFGCQESNNTVYSSIKSPISGNYFEITNEIDSMELLALNTNELRLLRNEIFARRGYIFTSNDLREYFSKFDWYEPTFGADEIDVKLSDVDNNNIRLIKSIEDSKKLVRWNSDIQDYLDLIPDLQLPLKFICDKGFKPAVLDNELEIIKQFKPENATIIGKLFQNSYEASIVYGFPADIFYPIIFKIDTTGKELEYLSVFELRECVDDGEYSARTYGTITEDLKLETRIVVYRREYDLERNEYIRKDSTVTETIRSIK